MPSTHGLMDSLAPLIDKMTDWVFEKTLEMNPGLVDLGPYLPIGTVIRIPLDQPKLVRTMPLIKLWD